MLLPCGHEIEEHVAVHEAGHAVTAVARGIDFQSLIFLSRNEIHERYTAGEQFMPGYVMPHQDRVSEWFTNGPESAIDFLAAGAFAEAKILGEPLRGGLDGDIRLFKLGMGVQSFTAEEATKWVSSAKERLTSDWVNLESRVELLAALVRRRFEASQGSEPFELTRQEIESALDALGHELG